jgi:hypothetical protein
MAGHMLPAKQHDGRRACYYSSSSSDGGGGGDGGDGSKELQPPMPCDDTFKGRAQAAQSTDVGDAAAAANNRPSLGLAVIARADQAPCQAQDVEQENAAVQVHNDVLHGRGNLVQHWCNNVFLRMSNCS